MKKELYKIFCFLLACGMFSCSDLKLGNKFLGEEPESSGATLEEMFSTRDNAEKVLNQAYTGLIYGIPTSGDDRMGGNITETLTDLCHSYRMNIGDGPNNLYYNGQLSPNNIDTKAAYFYGGETDWKTIRYAWVYIENVDKVPDMSLAEKNERKAEAKVLIALSYFRMMRYIGGVPWLDHAIDVNEEMKFPRKTFSETIDLIVALLDEAIPYMTWKHTSVDDGRMSKAGAMALKFQVLLWAASPTFNSDVLWHKDADEYTCYCNYDSKRWKRANSAGEAFFNELAANKEYSLILPEEENHRSRRLAYRKAYYDRGGSEVLISIRKGYANSTHDNFYGIRSLIRPTLNYVDMFPWSDGTDFPAEDFDWENPDQQPFFNLENGETVPTRDPRLYENVVVPGDLYWDGTVAPLHTNHPSYKSGSGFFVMKFVLQESSDRNNRPVQYPYLRLTEVMLSYAETLNEVNGKPNTLAYNLVNQIRARVGLNELPKGLGKDDFTKILLRERALELGFEEVRWFDLVRRNCEDDFTKQLYGLISTGMDDMNNPKQFTFKKVKLDQTRYWTDNWDTKWYMAPIPQKEINKKYGLIQNPGW